MEVTPVGDAKGTAERMTVNKGALAILVHGGSENWSPRRWKARFDEVCPDRRVLLLPDASFDLAVSEYGASLWADPYKWIPEAARLLRPGGRLVFMTNSTLVYLCAPDNAEEMVGEELLRDQFGMWRTKWPTYPGIEYHLSHGEWIRVLREHGFTIEALHELRPGEDAVDPTYYYAHPVEWARRWPAEELWEARLR